MAPPAARGPDAAAPGGGAATKGKPRKRPWARPWALLALLEVLEALSPRRGPCEAHYGTRGSVRWGRHAPRYGPVWWR